MASIARIALGTVAGGVILGLLVAWAMPSTTAPTTATSWTEGVGNRAAGAPLRADDQTTIDYGSNPPLTPPPRWTAEPETAYMPVDVNDHDYDRGRDAADAPPADDDEDAAAPVDDRAAQAADAARDAAEDARSAEDAPPPLVDDRTRRPAH